MIVLTVTDIDKKVNLLQLWGIKLEKATELPERTVDAITLVITPCARSSSHLLVTSTLSSFAPYFLPLVPTSSSQSHLRLAVSQLLPALIEKLNDAKDKIHEPARVCVALLGHKCYAADRADPSFLSASKGKEKAGIASSWEAMVKDVLAGRGVRGKLEALKMLLSMRGDTANPLPLKPWLPSLVNLLEDSDGSVRDQAREVSKAGKPLLIADGCDTAIPAIDASRRSIGAQEAHASTKRAEVYRRCHHRQGARDRHCKFTTDRRHNCLSIQGCSEISGCHACRRRCPSCIRKNTVVTTH